MNTIERLTSALGQPQAFWEVTDGSSFLGAVGRWCHEGARVDLSGTDTAQVIFNVSGGQQVELRSSAGAVCRTIRAGSVGIISPGSLVRVAIAGRADTVQIILGRNLLGPPAAGSPSLLPLRGTIRQARLQAAAIQALVGLTCGQPGSRDRLEKILRQVAGWLSASAATPPCGPIRGGLSPTAQRRVQALVDERLQADGCSTLAVAELARAAGLSVHHFIKAFRQTEGITPHAKVTARRLDLALGLLLQTNARVDRVAMQIGFSSPAHFVLAFRKHLGTTPGALREAAGLSRPKHRSKADRRTWPMRTV